MDFNAELIGSTLQGQLALFLETEWQRMISTNGLIKCLKTLKKWTTIVIITMVWLWSDEVFFVKLQTGCCKYTFCSSSKLSFLELQHKNITNKEKVSKYWRLKHSLLSENFKTKPKVFTACWTVSTLITTQLIQKNHFFHFSVATLPLNLPFKFICFCLNTGSICNICNTYLNVCEILIES